jgi:hypothetical protein
VWVEKLGGEGEKFARGDDFEHVAKTAIRDTPEADALHAQLAKGARTPELNALGQDLYAHEARCGTGCSPSWTES